MGLHITVQETREIPLYKQIAHAVQKEIVSGNLAAGDKLPTVRELSDQMGIARGTIKHAYEHLEKLGVVEMVQGRGSFVLSHEEDSASRKDRAMKAIDSLFEEMEELGFTPKEMEIYLKLKLKGLEEKYDLVKAAVVDCNPETLKLIENQLSQIHFLETATFSLSDVGDAAEKLNKDYDLVLTTSTHYSEVETLIRDDRRLAMMALMPARETLINLARLSDDERVGIACASRNFSRIVRDNCLSLGPWSLELPCHFFGNGKKMEEFLQDKTTVIVPQSAESFATASESRLLLHFEQEGGSLVRYNYAVDRGSLLYVEELTKKILNKKRSV